MRHIHPHHLGSELCVPQDLLFRYQACFDNFLIVVDVVNETVECSDALHQTTLHALPLVGRNNARDQVKRNESLGTRARLVFVAVDRKGNADTSENHFGFFTARKHDLLTLTR